MPRKRQPQPTTRLSYDDDFKAEAVQMLLDGHSAQSICDRLGISGTNLLYRWKKEHLEAAGPVGETLDSRVHDLEAELRCVERERDVLKKSFGHFRPTRVTEIYPVAQGIIESKSASERQVCEFLKFAKAPFQRWKQFELSSLEQEDKAVLPLIVKTFHAHRRRYGTRRIMEDLRDQGLHLGRRRIAKLMKIAGISAIGPKLFKPRTTQSKHTLGYNENLIMNLKELTGPNCLWVGDITYISIQEIEYGYLAALMGRFSRRIVGWKLVVDMTERIVIYSLRMAIRNRKPKPGLVHHSDRGGQYAGKEYRKIIKRARIKQSMSRAGDCYDNAFMESCFGTIETELEMTEYKNYHEALRDI